MVLCLLYLPAAPAKKMLGAEYGVYHHAQWQRHTVRTTRYSLPQKLHDFIVMIQPTTFFINLGASKAYKLNVLFTGEATEVNHRVARTDIPLYDRQGTTLECLQTLYEIQGYARQSRQPTIGITGFIAEDPSTDDLGSYPSIHPFRRIQRIPSKSSRMA